MVDTGTSMLKLSVVIIVLCLCVGVSFFLFNVVMNEKVKVTETIGDIDVRGSLSELDGSSISGAGIQSLVVRGVICYDSAALPITPTRAWMNSNPPLTTAQARNNFPTSHWYEVEVIYIDNMEWIKILTT